MTLQNSDNHPHSEEVYNVSMQAISDQCFKFDSNILIQVSLATAFDFLLVAHHQIELPVQHFDFLLIIQTKLSF
eukprot:840668-Rhodomonas_salina.1